MTRDMRVEVQPSSDEQDDFLDDESPVEVSTMSSDKTAPQSGGATKMVGATKGQVKVLAATAVVVVGVLFVAISALKRPAPNQQSLPGEMQGVQVGAAPQLNDTGDAQVANSPIYSTMVTEVEAQKAKEAIESGASHQPRADLLESTLVASKTPAQIEEEARQAAALAEQKRIAEEARARAASMTAQPQHQEGPQISTQAQEERQRRMQMADSIIAQLMVNSDRGMQEFKSRDTQAATGQQATAGAASAGGQVGGATQAEATKSLTLISAGTVESVEMQTAVNTDLQGSFVAKLLTGPYAGALLVGSSERVEDLAVLSFKSLSLPGKGITVAINAMALDPTTMEPGTATDVDRKLLVKYGFKPFVAGVAAIGQAVMQAGTTVVTSSGSTVTQTPPVDGKMAAKIAAGAAAQQLSQDSGALNTTPTVRVRPRSVLGIVFTSDVLYRQPSGG